MIFCCRTQDEQLAEVGIVAVCMGNVCSRYYACEKAPERCFFRIFQNTMLNLEHQLAIFRKLEPSIKTSQVHPKVVTLNNNS